MVSDADAENAGSNDKNVWHHSVTSSLPLVTIGTGAERHKSHVHPLKNPSAVKAN
jgi:hypothetical protein